MLTTKEKLLAVFGMSVIAIAFSGLVAMIAEYYFYETSFQATSSFLYRMATVLGTLATSAIVTLVIVREWHELHVVKNMAMIDRNKVIAVHRFGEAVVQMPVTEHSTQYVVIGPTALNPPYIQRNPIELQHIAGELPPIEELDNEEYLGYQSLFKK